MRTVFEMALDLEQLNAELAYAQRNGVPEDEIALLKATRNDLSREIHRRLFKTDDTIQLDRDRLLKTARVDEVGKS